MPSIPRPVPSAVVVLLGVLSVPSGRGASAEPAPRIPMSQLASSPCRPDRSGDQPCFAMLRLYAHYPGITARIAEGEPLPESLSLDGLAGRPPGYVLATRPNRGLLATGLGIWGGAYVLAAIGAASAAIGPVAPDPAANLLLVPVAGPVLYVASSDGEPSGGLMAFAILDALVQAGGLGMALASSLRTLRTPYYRRADLAKREASPSTRLRVSIGPRGGGAFWSF